MNNKKIKSALNWLKDAWPLLLGSLAIFSICYFGSFKLREFKWVFYYFSFMLCFLTVNLPNNKYTRIISGIVMFPIYLFKLIEPIFLLLVCLMLHFGIYLLLWECLMFLNKIELLNLNHSAILYICLTLGSTCILLFGKYIIIYVVNTLKDEHRPYMKKLKSDFIQLFLNQDIFRVLIYSLYFVILVLSSINSFDSINVKFLSKFQSPILQSFATFVAFERIVNNKQVLSGIKKKLKDKIILIWLGTSLPPGSNYYFQVKKDGKSEDINYVSEREHFDFYMKYNEQLDASHCFATV